MAAFSRALIAPLAFALPEARTLKRAMDLAVGIPLFLISLPIVVLCTAMVFMADPGPLFFVQERAGFHGKRMRVWKIRSMARNAEAQLAELLAKDETFAAEWRVRFKLKNDPRVLPFIGRFMRRHSLDELPQLWNVVKGEMSLVGPRAFADYDLNLYSPEQLKIRQNVMPGLTGLWQVSARNQGDNRDKIRYDMTYTNNWSLALDWDILCRTVGVVLTGRGAF